MVKLHVLSVFVAALLAVTTTSAQNPAAQYDFRQVAPSSSVAASVTAATVVPPSESTKQPVVVSPSESTKQSAVISQSPSTSPPSTAVPSPSPSPSPIPTPTASTVKPTPSPTPSATPAKTPVPTTPQIKLPHWVGSLKGKTSGDSCYRKTYITKDRKCGAGYNFDNIATCWTQCPVEYPVECGLECLGQNSDCTKAIFRKVASVANVALNLATSGVFGKLDKARKGVQTTVKCGQQLFSTVTKITNFVKEYQNGAKVNTTKDQLLQLLDKSDFVVYDLPVAVTTCLGLPIPTGLSKTQDVILATKNVVNMVVNNNLSGVNLLDFSTFLRVAKAELPLVGKTVSTMTPSDEDQLKGLVGSGVTCGTDIFSVVNRIIAVIQDLKTKNPTSGLDAVQFAVFNSDLVLKLLPNAASSCVNSATGFSSRDDILKTAHTMIDKVISASSKDGNPVSKADYAISIADMGLDAIGLIDPTGIAAMAAEFIQPICGPTAYIGDIDDGPAEQAVGLNSIQKAFRDSTGTWKKTGDGQLRLKFISVDDKDVRVNIMSGGKKLYEVKVKKGTTVEWNKPLSEFQGKTLYMDRWRPGFLGIPGTGGGSLLSWVPMDSDGTLSLDVKINPTSFKDHKLRH